MPDYPPGIFVPVANFKKKLFLISIHDILFSNGVGKMRKSDLFAAEGSLCI